MGRFHRHCPFVESVASFAVMWMLLRMALGRKMMRWRMLAAGVLLGTFPRVLHVLFFVWDYPHDEMLCVLVRVATLTARWMAVSALVPCPQSRWTTAAIGGGLLADWLLEWGMRRGLSWRWPVG